MDIAKLEVSTRPGRGTRAARRLRKEGKLPGIIYGHKETPEQVSVPAHDLSLLLEHGAHLVELNVNGSTKQVLIKDVQFDHSEQVPLHVDFTRVDLTERVHVAVPLEFRGTPKGVHEGGTLEPNLMDVEIECLVTEIPNQIQVSVSEMHVGDNLHVGDLELPPNITAVTPAETIVCSVRAKTAAAEIEEMEIEAEGEAQEPEIIRRQEKEEESEEG